MHEPDPYQTPQLSRATQIGVYDVLDMCLKFRLQVDKPDADSIRVRSGYPCDVAHLKFDSNGTALQEETPFQDRPVRQHLRCLKRGAGYANVKERRHSDRGQRRPRSLHLGARTLATVVEPPAQRQDQRGKLMVLLGREVLNALEDDGLFTRVDDTWRTFHRLPQNGADSRQSSLSLHPAPEKQSLRAVQSAM